jgi:hypothetical protein
MSLDPNKLVRLGSYANDGTGDNLREAFIKVNALFEELYVESPINGVDNLPGGAEIYKNRVGTHLELRSIASDDGSVIATAGANTVNLRAVTTVLNDTSPSLGGNLLLNGHNIIGAGVGGDVQSTVFGIDIRLLNSLVAIALENQIINVDLGSILNPTGPGSSGYSLDFGSFTSAPINSYDFGTI